MNKTGFGALNWTVLVIYLLVMVALGFYFSKRSGKDTHSFFKAGGKIPGWAAGLSIYATTISAITYMSTPAKSFATNWLYAFGNLTIIAIVPLLIYFYIPFFRKLNVTSAYEYLEERFHISLRLCGSIMFILFHVGRAAIVIYLPTLAITSVTTINPYLVAICIGVLCIIYTYLGGMEGVVWTDVIQAIILLGGAVLIIAFGVFNIRGGFSTIMTDVVNQHKFIPKEAWKWSFASASIPVIFIGSIFNSIYQYTASQDVVQRYTSTKSLADTKKSLWINALFAFITIPIFYGMGTVLYSYYRQHHVLGSGFNTANIVPYFVLTTVPAGIAGLIIAAIFAASQGTMSSTLNSMAACVVTDFKQRFFPQSTEKSNVSWARAVVLISGLVGVLASLYIIHTHQSQILDLWLSLFGLLGVPIAATFALGIFTNRANSMGALIGLIAGVVISVVLNEYKFNAFMLSVVGFVSSYVIGYVVSFVFPKSAKKTKGLTVFTINSEVSDKQLNMVVGSHEGI